MSKEKKANESKKPEMKLTESEYFRLEACDWKMDELNLKAKLIASEIQSAKRELSIMDYKRREIQREIANKQDSLQSFKAKEVRIAAEKKDVSTSISSRLGLPESFGYNPDTLEIITEG
jgi:hypothetical protein